MSARTIRGPHEASALPAYTILRDIQTGIFYQLIHNADPDEEVFTLHPRLLTFGWDGVIAIGEETVLAVMHTPERTH